MIIIKDLALEFGGKLLFSDVNLSLAPGAKYALLGANGAGKSSFLKLLSLEEEPSLGEVQINSRAKIGILKQDQFLYENVLIVNTVIAGRKKLWQAICEKEKILENPEISDEDGYRLGELEHIIMEEDGYLAEEFAARILVGLGIKEEYHYLPLSSLSGGYKLRVLLAQSLFNKPDILLLDEPTNHLDIQSIWWLENYLQEEFEGVLLFISHDISFINNLANYILDIDYGEIRQYTGNYTQFTSEKKQVSELILQHTVNIEKKITRMQGFVERFGAKASKARQAKSRQKMIEKIELPDVKRTSRISPIFSFPILRNSGKEVLRVTDLQKSFSSNTVLSNVNFVVTRKDKIAIIGPNGVGKSTLLKIILDTIKPNQGSVEWGFETNCSYFSQDAHDILKENTTILNWLHSKVSVDHDLKIRSALGHVLFKQDDVNKNIKTLSGGEAARLLLAKIMLEQPNVLILDEPTNHLDIEAKTALKQALIEYKGTLIMVTHDRDFAAEIPNKILAITPGRVRSFAGNYDDYLKANKQNYLRT